MNTNDSTEIQKVCSRKFITSVFSLLISFQWHDATLKPLLELQPPNLNGKPVLGPDDLLVLQTFNIAYDTGTFPLERHRVQLSGSCLLLAYTGARPAEIVDNEKKKPKDELWEDMSGTMEASSDDDQEPGLLEQLLMQETTSRGLSKTLCYEDISMMVVRHPSTGRDVVCMADKKPKP